LRKGWERLEISVCGCIGGKILGEKKHSSQTAAAAVWRISKAAMIR
jgi:hypothetical protein